MFKSSHITCYSIILNYFGMLVHYKLLLIYIYINVLFKFCFKSLNYNITKQKSHSAMAILKKIIIQKYFLNCQKI